MVVVGKGLFFVFETTLRRVSFVSLPVPGGRDKERQIHSTREFGSIVVRLMGKGRMWKVFSEEVVKLEAMLQQPCRMYKLCR